MKDYFASAAWYYARYRAFYPKEVIDDIVAFFELQKDHRVLDIGAGTGQLAIQMAEHAKEVVAIEIDSDMIKEGKELCREHGTENIHWIQTVAEQLGSASELGRFNLATFGTSFHWMNQQPLLVFLDSVIEPGGGVAVAWSPSVWWPTEEWGHAVKKLIQKYLGEERRAGTGTFKTAVNTDERFEDILKHSPFSSVEEKKYRIQRQQTTEQVIGRIFSTSFSNPAVLGGKKEMFENELREVLTKINPEGLFEKTDEYYLFLARRV